MWDGRHVDRKTLSHCNPIPNSEHGLDWNIEKNPFLVLILGLGLFPSFFWIFGFFYRFF
jgi:hypothetical protein